MVHGSAGLSLHCSNACRRRRRRSSTIFVPILKLCYKIKKHKIIFFGIMQFVDIYIV
jgi:hypothetical protein